MATWIKCQAYTQHREPLWINLDQVVVIRGHENGSILVCAATENNVLAEFTVWDSPEDILAQQRAVEAGRL